MKFLDIDSPFMQGLGKMADLMILNLLTLLCCIPIVTIGASLTAMHYMTLKIVRNEENYIARGFFKSFKQNFRQGTIIWLIQLIAFLILGGDFYIMFTSEKGFPFVLQVMLFVVGVIVLMISAFLYPMLAKFDNTIPRTIKNALFISILQFPKTLVITFLNVLPIVAAIMAPPIIPLCILFGLSLPAYVAALLYNKYFKKLEDRLTGAQDGADETSASEEGQENLEDEVVMPDHSSEEIK